LLADHIFKSLNLNRDVSEIGAEEMATLESNGVKFGTGQKQKLNINPNLSQNDQGCC
jgi:hypothetical protein